MSVDAQIAALKARGFGATRIARELGIPRSTVRCRLGALEPRNEALEALGLEEGLVDRTFRDDGSSATAEARVPRFIATIDEAIAAAGVDLAVWEVQGWETRAYPMQTAEGPVQGSYVKLRLTRKARGSDPDAIVAAITRGLEAAIPRVGVVVPRAVPRFTRSQVLRTRIITDLHFGGYAWSKTTGGANWDIGLASETAHAANAYLDAHAPEDATETLIACLGDLAHYDTPKGTTTGGTQLDLDSRVDLMLAAVSEYLVTTIREEAERRPTTVLLVEGNHDAILSKALRRMLLLVFATHRNVRVIEEYTKRQYHRYGDTLLGFTHGDGNRQRMVDVMAAETGRLNLWDGARCRELHLGHVHHESARQKVLTGAEALHGTVVRTHLALTPPDQYHADNGWVGGASGMSDWYYHAKGALVGTRIAVPHLLDVTP